jgi:cobalt/nickel transport system permease protein
MHISDGILTETAAGVTVLVSASALAVAGTAVGLSKLDYERVPRAAVLSAAFFVASLVHIKVGATSLHLVLNGLVGVILGWASFPAFLIALFLQTVFFGHGGFTTLGLNTFNFAITALIAYYLVNAMLRSSRKKWAVFLLGFLGGSIPLLMSGALIMVELALTGEEFQYLAGAFFIAHIPVAIIEGIITGFAVAFLKRVKPELLEAPLRDQDI